MKAPDPRPRPKFAHWRFERNLSLVKTAGLIERSAQALDLVVTCSDETVRLICLPFDDKRRRVPSGDMARAIAHLTERAVCAPDFYPVRTAA